ncbi:MAG: hypothetical protein IPL19_20410 [Sandaracinaceae bacterium]|nr:hypothetical protein [Sandaracinaceae bacterium]
MQADQVNLEVLTRLQHGSERLPHALRDYIQYIHDEFDAIDSVFGYMCEESRAEFQGMGHARVTESLSYAFSALMVLANYVSRRHPGLLDVEEFTSWAKTSLQSLGAAQGMATQELDPVRIILEKVQEAISSGSAHLREEAGPQTHRRGVQIGWKRGTDVFLLKQPTWKFITESLQATGSGGRRSPRASSGRDSMSAATSQPALPGELERSRLASGET